MGRFRNAVFFTADLLYFSFKNGYLKKAQILQKRMVQLLGNRPFFKRVPRFAIIESGVFAVQLNLGFFCTKTIQKRSFSTLIEIRILSKAFAPHIPRFILFRNFYRNFLIFIVRVSMFCELCVVFFPILFQS